MNFPAKARLGVLAGAFAIVASTATANPSDLNSANLNDVNIGDNVTPMIVGGNPSPEGSRPWMVSLQTSGHFCGGSLIREDWVLTAAHCVDGSTSGLKAVIGRHDLGTNAGQSISVAEVIVHPSWNSNTMDNDIALLRLSQPTSLNIPLLPLPTAQMAGEATQPGDTVTVSGWGRLSEGGASPDVLYEVDLPMVSNATCNQAYGGDITNNMMCAGQSSGGIDSCQGDSGGPLVFNWAGQDYQAGIVSWGIGCARPSYYGVYTRLTNYLSWIDGHIDDTPPGDEELTNGVTESGISGATGSQLYFYIDVPAGANNLTFTMAGGSGDADLYVRRGSKPTTSSYDCRPYKGGNNETCAMGSVSSSSRYWVMVRGYSSYSNTSLVAQYQEDSDPPPGDDLLETNLSASRGQWLDYTIEVPAGSSRLVVNSSGGSGDADLYVRFGDLPTSSSYDCRPYKSGNNESCTINSPRAGTWYVSLKAYSSFSGVTLSASAQ